MQYHWLDCPRCACHVAVNWTVYADRVSGSLRRWSADRSTNDGRLFEVPASQTASDGGFAISCVCGQEIAVPGKPDAVGASRDPGLRVTLGEG